MEPSRARWTSYRLEPKLGIPLGTLWLLKEGEGALDDLVEGGMSPLFGGTRPDCEPGIGENRIHEYLKVYC